MHNKNIRELKKKAQINAEHINKWFVLNKLSLSISKSNFVLFHSKNKNPHDDFNEIKLGHETITRVSDVKYIGLTIDEKLSWDKQINEVCKSLVKYFTVFYNLRNKLPNKLPRILYY